MDVVERRAAKRVCPPHDALLDFALWPTAPEPLARLPLAALGPPLVCRAAGDRLAVADITAIGLGLRVAARDEAAPQLTRALALHVYLKLRDYRPQAPSGVLSLFTHARVVRAVTLPEALALGLQLTRQGRGSSFEKALELLDVSRFGIPELTAWIDALERDWHTVGRPPLGPGLDLDHLLEEPTCQPTAVLGERTRA